MSLIHQTTRLHDLPCIQLRNGDARAIVALRGAQLLSWTPAGGNERLSCPVARISPPAQPSAAACR